MTQPKRTRFLIEVVVPDGAGTAAGRVKRLLSDAFPGPVVVHEVTGPVVMKDGAYVVPVAIEPQPVSVVPVGQLGLFGGVAC